MKIRIHIFVFFLPLFLVAQDIESVWQDYTRIKGDLEQVESQQATLMEEQMGLRKEIQRLKDNASWYNSWYNNLVIASHTERQVQLAVDLDELDKELIPLRQDHEQSLKYLKESYAQLAREYGNQAQLSDETRQVAQRVGRILQDSGSSALDLPDYSDLVNDSYQNPVLKRLVLQDVHQLITTKLIMIDSLIQVAQEEEELAERLDAFHKDLGLQIEAGQDLRDDNGNAAPASFSWESAQDERLDTGTDAYMEIQNATATESRALPVEREALIAPTNSPQSQLQVLEKKKNDYRSLLQQVQEELITP